jgi:hypothetical protein
MLAAALCLTSVLAGEPRAAAQAGDRWSDFRFLIGTWEGVGKGQPGEGAGAFSFELSLDGAVLIRRSQSSYPATKERPASTHEDLMVIFPEGGRMHAIYFDNEGHVIRYEVTVAGTPRTVTLVSPPSPDAPRFRFVYRVVDANTVNGRFEIAPPGKPDAFALYIEGDARRIRRRD